MKLLIDLTGAQTRSHRRGIGRYTRELTKAFLRQSDGLDVHLALSAPLEAATDALLTELGDTVPAEQRHYLRLPYGTAEEAPTNRWRNASASRLFAHAIDTIAPDIVLHSSLFEGFDEDAVLPDFDKTRALHAAILYDVIPLQDLDQHLPGILARTWYRKRADQLLRADIVLSISQWSAQDASERLGLDQQRVTVIGTGVDARFSPSAFDSVPCAAVLSSLGIERPYVLCSGGLDRRKNVPALLEAFARMPEGLRARHQLVVTGDDREALRALNAQADRLGIDASRRVFVGHVDDATLIELYRQCALFVFPSLQEGFGLPALEAMACGAPVICSDVSSLPEVVGHPDLLVPPGDVAALSTRMAAVLDSPVRAQAMRAHGLQRATNFSWDAVATRARVGLEAAIRQRDAAEGPRDATRTAPFQRDTETALLDDLAGLPGRATADDVAQAAFSVCSMRPRTSTPQWLVDVSSIAANDIGTGTHRVTRSILREWLRAPPEGVRVVPVRFADGHYRHAEHFAGTLAKAETVHRDGIVMPHPGDVFVGLDWAPEATIAAASRLADWRRGGVATCFVAHDILPISHPEYFHPHARQVFDSWLRQVAYLSDCIACVSRTTAEAISGWLPEDARYQFGRSPHVGSFALGADFSPGVAELGSIRPAVREALQRGATLLSVGTIEPRKGHADALRICQALWDRGEAANLVIVGRRGWSEDALERQLRQHPLNGTALFWLEDANDVELAALYVHATALLALSKAEGFGLPLVEAASIGLPILARPLPVFREVLGTYPHFLDADAPCSWAAAVENWLHAPTSHPAKSMMSWHESAQLLAELIAVNLRDH
ncbi:glycosyltransferase family 4 protein [Luteimonas fraxinea]|uniref:glycosyltransferase family 4 protein n=1 Tax=Luteimonas fraxinea TaxID=2901869 RepID=UPI001E432FE3|nr:glycosyltransferase family 1 protein [Luteimonas fraxinea]MCD9124439.1 glycosyltransferase family 4 protein [Luteimonas fraxinea]